MSGILEEILSNKQELVAALLKVMEGKEAKAKVNLNGVKFNFGGSSVKMEGSIEFTVIPIDKKR